MMAGIEWPQLPDMGVYLTWPEQGLQAIHPDDQAIAEELIPSDRVFRRTAFDGVYYTAEFGDRTIRIKPSLWLQVKDEGLRIGDQVEVPSRMMQADPLIGVIIDMRYCQDQGIIRYGLLHSDMPLDHTFRAEELIPLSSHAQLQSPDFQAPMPQHQPPPDSDQPLSIDEELES